MKANKFEKMYQVRVERDNEGYWGYDPTFMQYISRDKKQAFEKVIEELRTIVTTMRGRNSYPERITKMIQALLDSYDSGLEEYLTVIHDDTYYNINNSEIWLMGEWGNASISIEIEEVEVAKTDAGEIIIL